MIWLLICFNRKLNPVVTELSIRDRKLNISLVFITKFYVAVPKNIRRNSTHFFIMKVPNKWELQQITLKKSFRKNIKTNHENWW